MCVSFILDTRGRPHAETPHIHTEVIELMMFQEIPNMDKQGITIAVTE